MRFQFDPDLEYQRDAVQAVVDLFSGQPLAGSAMVEMTAPDGTLMGDFGLANNLLLTPDGIKDNLKQITKRNKLDFANPFDEPNIFTVEMETGTGKTYVYLRTILELNKAYGWNKFIIVVPSIAIREGVMKSIEMTRAHFKEQYDAVPYDSWPYDSKQASKLRGFANSNALQILIINIQAFDKKDISVIHRDNDKMSGYKPIDFIKNSNPIIIVDEPQNMTSKNRKSAIEALNPLFELRYSATHKEIVNLVYKLDPVKAYDLGLVKQIRVYSVLEDANFNLPYIAVKSITPGKRGIAAMIEIDVEQKTGPKRKVVKLSSGDEDLFELSGFRSIYQDWRVAEITTEHIQFSNGTSVAIGTSIESNTDEIMRAQIRQTIKQHLQREDAMSKLSEGERMKVLTLFFIDRVANYASADGKIRNWFEDAYNEAVSGRPNPLPVTSVHSGYFAQDKSGPKDTQEGDSAANEEAFELIMRDKERLLSEEEPLRFIFSHSALREGWDNPNVFQICTLNETRSEIKKRQEIGRGLRLPVRFDGTRCKDRAIAQLTVIANEHYEAFAKALQKEIEEECGVTFEGRIANERDKERITLRKGWNVDPEFLKIWEKIKHRTKYNVRFDSARLVQNAAAEFRMGRRLTKPKLRVIGTDLSITGKGVYATVTETGTGDSMNNRRPLPNIIGEIQRRTELTRPTIVDFLCESGRLGEVDIDPQGFVEQASAYLTAALRELLVQGIEYVKLDGLCFDQRIFEDEEIDTYVKNLIESRRGLYDKFVVDSGVERSFAEKLEKRGDILLFFKLPSRFTIDTPIGTYNPDWAIVKQEDAGPRLHMIRETKGDLDPAKLRNSETAKNHCGKMHFEALGVDYDVVKIADSV